MIYLFDDSLRSMPEWYSMGFTSHIVNRCSCITMKVSINSMQQNRNVRHYLLRKLNVKVGEEWNCWIPVIQWCTIVMYISRQNICLVRVPLQMVCQASLVATKIMIFSSSYKYWRWLNMYTSCLNHWGNYIFALCFKQVKQRSELKHQEKKL